MRFKRSEFLAITLMFFSMFFGAGNLIFPTIIGHVSGEYLIFGLVGFAITAIVIPIIGIITVSKSEGMEPLASRVSPHFGTFFTFSVLFAIGPGLAMPRTGILPFEIGIKPLLSQNLGIWQVVFTILFFLTVYLLSIRPNKLVDIMGKIITPTLLILILILFLSILVKQPLKLNIPAEAPSKTFFNAFLEGYQTLDALAALNYGTVIVFTIQQYNVTDRQEQLSLAKKFGILTGIILLLVYSVLSLIGALTPMQGFTNGADIISSVGTNNLGFIGQIMIAAIFTLACLATCTGLTTSISRYFSQRFTKTTYKQWVIGLVTFSLLIANFGLDTLLTVSVPFLMSLYPVSLMLIILGFFDYFNKNNYRVYKIVIPFVFVISIIDVLITNNILPNIFAWIPLQDYGLAWLLPTLILIAISTLIPKHKKDDSNLN